jgi:hypothetical protein
MLSTVLKKAPLSKIPVNFIHMKTFLLLIFVSVIHLICSGQDEWALKKNENGIAVYTRKLNNEKYKEIRVICEFNGRAERLIQILQDVDGHKNWVYKTTKSYLISRKNQDTLFYYSEIDLPWPQVTVTQWFN